MRQRRKQMHRYPMLWDGTYPHRSNGHTAQGTLHMECDAYQIAQGHLLTELEPTILKCIWNHWRPRGAKAIHKHEPTLPDCTQNYKATVIQTSRDWHRTSHMDPWNRIGSPEINSQTEQSMNLPQSMQDWTLEKRQSPWPSSVEKPGWQHLSHTTYNTTSPRTRQWTQHALHTQILDKTQ